MRQRSIIAWAVACAALIPRLASAQPAVVTAGLTLDFLNGKHDTGTSVNRLTFVPLPLADLDVRVGRTSLHLEGFPPLTFGYGNAVAGRQQTQLSIVNAVLRQTVAGGAFIGAGQTIYNQRTTYPAGVAASLAEQASRVTGTRFELGWTGQGMRTTRIEFAAAINPAMRGVEYTLLRGASTPGPIRNPERAVQVDTSIAFVTPLRHGALVYGLRYLNYASRYDLRGTTANGSLADRNTGVMPLVSYRIGL